MSRQDAVVWACMLGGFLVGLQFGRLWGLWEAERRGGEG